MDLTINGIDHSVFNLDWVKIGAAFNLSTSEGTALFCYIHGVTFPLAKKSHDGIWEKIGDLEFEASQVTDKEVLGLTTDDEVLCRMATPDECTAAGIAYIKPPMLWLNIASAPKNGMQILLLVDDEDGADQYVGWWNDVYQDWRVRDGNYQPTTLSTEPTKWQPLPPLSEV
jgi:hypothetical protein